MSKQKHCELVHARFETNYEELNQSLEIPFIHIVHIAVRAALPALTSIYMPNRDYYPQNGCECVNHSFSKPSATVWNNRFRCLTAFAPPN